jgi:hypothetical protein
MEPDIILLRSHEPATVPCYVLKESNPRSSHIYYIICDFTGGMSTEIYRGIVSFGIFLLHLNELFPNSDQYSHR